MVFVLANCPILNFLCNVIVWHHALFGDHPNHIINFSLQEVSFCWYALDYSVFSKSRFLSNSTDDLNLFRWQQWWCGFCTLPSTCLLLSWWYCWNIVLWKIPVELRSPNGDNFELWLETALVLCKDHYPRVLLFCFPNGNYQYLDARNAYSRKLMWSLVIDTHVRKKINKASINESQAHHITFLLASNLHCKSFSKTTSIYQIMTLDSVSALRKTKFQWTPRLTEGYIHFLKKILVLCHILPKWWTGSCCTHRKERSQKYWFARRALVHVFHWTNGSNWTPQTNSWQFFGLESGSA